MKQFNAKVFEEFGYKAYRRGFFKKWQQLSSSIKENEDLPLDDAAIKAYKQLKLEGSE
jgi:hypothetical protein